MRRTANINGIAQADLAETLKIQIDLAGHQLSNRFDSSPPHQGELMLIVAGHLKIKKGKRDEFLRLSKEAVIAARKDNQCLAFYVTADLIESDQVCIFEKWRSKKSLENFRDNGPGDDLSSLIVSAKVEEYGIKT